MNRNSAPNQTAWFGNRRGFLQSIPPCRYVPLHRVPAHLALVLLGVSPHQQYGLSGLAHTLARSVCLGDTRYAQYGSHQFVGKSRWLWSVRKADPTLPLGDEHAQCKGHYALPTQQ
ncbi:Uncharacterised protein [Vibrio cholerae]|uniref:Uncharacterized protein n=1 Tax=Vibrio cholerae TaxID=666 RepID=A0A655Z2N2_VIBCL|nr:Uncharacterised protein [Vibrio cholerae]CSC15892.1 Uncharacterised protein [Vibrio cholerae]CSC57054.1 Uncharacterised protein [Vibrio cholerae]CSD35037.1 Uncharacterised protein [Vibrio cholerae]CSI42906.1 Uncharacterised protein [Vibrio cholerae]